jgi:transcriptional regulator NrdR family protein
MNLQVQKKDNSLQPFDKSKVAAGLIRSGASVEEAENVASQVEAWAQTSAVDGVIKSLDLRAKVLEVLKTVNEAVAIAFENYQKPLPEPEAPTDPQPQA